MKKSVMLLSVLSLIGFLSFGQENLLFSDVQHAKNSNVYFESVVLPETEPETAILEHFTNPDDVFFFGNISFDFNSSNVKAMNLRMLDITLELVEAPKYFYNYVVTTSSGGRFSANRNIKHYRGIVQNDPNSLVAITIYEDEIMGLVCTAEGNFNIAKESRSGKHVFYNDNNLKEKMQMNCGTVNNDFSPYEPEVLLQQQSRSGQNKKVGFYVETEYDIFQTRGSIAAVEAYIAALFNQVAILYRNENIATFISELFVWDTVDPFTGDNTDVLLTQFKQIRTSINGDLGILLTFRSIGGGQAAGFNGLCNPSTSESLSVAMINNSFSPFPKYTWTIMVVTHELGHLFGSRHTHACVWNGDNTAIDGCAGYVEGYCSLPGHPPEGGTMMSYCHGSSVGINFSLGFGPQPGNVIRNRVANAACLAFLTLEIMDIRLPEETPAIESGETSDVLIYLKNISHDTATNLTAELSSDSPYITINQSTAYYGQLYPEQYKHKVYNITINPDTPSGTTEAPILLTVTDDLGRVMELESIFYFENSGETPPSCNPIKNLSTETTGADIKLSWEAPSGSAPKEYLVYYNNQFLKSTTELTCTHTNVKLNIYRYCVEAVYTDGCTSELTCEETVTPCNINIKLTLKSYNDGVNLTWVPNVENVTYKVFCNEELVAEIAENNHKYYISNFDERYCFTIVAVCPADLESEPSNQACAGGVGIDEISTGSTPIQIYPNPTTGELRVTSNQLPVTSVEIFDVYGKLVSNLTSQISNLTVLPSGIYFIRIQTENETIIRKVVKQ